MIGINCCGKGIQFQWRWICKIYARIMLKLLYWNWYRRYEFYGINLSILLIWSIFWGLRMPIYEYVCMDCNNQFEVIRTMMAADEPIACVNCEGIQTSRMLSLFNAQSGGRVVAGGNSGCASCSSNACSTCGVNWATIQFNPYME